MLNRRVIGEFIEGTVQGQNYAPLANPMAEQTRRSREARGLPITPRQAGPSLAEGMTW